MTTQYLQVSLDDGQTWNNLLPLSAITGPQGAQGIQGETGAQGPQGAQGPKGDPGGNGADSADYPNVGVSTDETVCGIAQFVGGKVNDIMVDNLNRCNALGTYITAAAVASLSEEAVATALVDLGIIEVGFAAGAIPVAILAIAQFVISAGVNYIIAEFSSTAKEHVIKNLYCALNGTATMNASVISAWKAANSTDSVLGNIVTFINNTIDTMSAATYVKLAWKGSVNPSNLCVDYNCPGSGWCYKFDFAASNCGWQAGSEGGVWISGYGWSTVADSGNQVGGTLSPVWTNFTISQAKIKFHIQSSDPYDNTYFQAYTDGTITWSQLIDSSVGTHEQTFDFSPAKTIDRLNVYLDAALAGSNNNWVESIELHGPDTNPFGSDNCT